MDGFSWGGGGGEEDSRGQVLQSRFRRRHTGSNNPIFGTARRPLPHTEDSEGSAAPRSVTDFTDQWVWCIMHMCGYRCNERLKVKTDGSSVYYNG